jgi:hypothetical protein
VTAAARVERARSIDPRLVGLEALSAAIGWFRGRCSGPPGAVGPLVAWFHEGVRDQVEGRLTPDSAVLTERILAEALLTAASPGPFVDAEQRLPRALLERCRGGRGDEVQRREIGELLLGRLHARADLWGVYGDLCWCAERHDEAMAAYARALLLGPDRVDPVHLAMPALRDRWWSLRREAPETAAARWFAEAVIAGELVVPVGNRWLAQVPWAAAAADASPWARFCWAVYVDRTAGDSGDLLARRLAMAELQPEAFARYMAAVCGGAPTRRR